MANADCIVIQGSNMAECHPVGFQWVAEAKARGARVIHVDPRFTRTSAVADQHVPIRAGSDVVLLGALINHVLAHDLWFRDYVLAYTNAATLVDEDFRDAEDLDGLFSGYDEETGQYDQESWAYDQEDGDEVGGATGGHEHGSSKSGSAAGDLHGSGGPALEHAKIKRDETLQHPRTVFQILKRHYARYTPEMVRDACGIPVEDFHALARAVTENSGRERTTCFAYAVGWTQHSLGAQFIRTAAILQLLLGNMGRPGGGIMALRGHASIQGSTDIPTLFNLLPGYLPMPRPGCRTLSRSTSPRSPASSRRASGPTPTPTPPACSRPGGATRRRRRTTTPSTTSRVSPARTGPTRPSRTWTTARWRATSCSARTPPSARPTDGSSARRCAS